MKTPLIATCGALVLFFSACTKPAETPKPIDLTQLKADIQKLEDAYAAGEKTKDAAAIVAYYADDAISYNRNTAPLSGKATIQKEIEASIAKDTTNTYNVYKVVDVFAEGNMAVEIGSWTKMNPSGETVKSGHYLSYFEKRNGKYVCVRDMNVNSAPETPVMQ